jgi:hypothetical protein
MLEPDKAPEPEVVTKPEPSLAGVTGAALDPDLKVKKNYVRKSNNQQDGADAAKETGKQRCPNCRQEIQKSDWQEHFKLCVMDKKWKE